MKKNRLLLCITLVGFLTCATPNAFGAETDIAINKALKTTSTTETNIISREELAFTLAKYLGTNNNETTSSSFVDINDVSAEFLDYFLLAADLGLISGENTPNGLFAYPKRSVTNQEAAVMLSKTLNIAPDNEGIHTVGEPWAAGYIAALKRYGLLWADENGNFDPLSPIEANIINELINSAQFDTILNPPKIKVVADKLSVTSENSPAISSPMGITKDSQGNIYIADTGNSTIIEIYSDGNIETYAGQQSPFDVYGLAIGGYVDASKNLAYFDSPTDILLTSAGLMIADADNNAIRLISGGNTYTYAGTSTAGHLDGNKKDALFNSPTAMAVDEAGNIYISDTNNHVIRKIDILGEVTTIAGTPNTPGFLDGDAKGTLLCEPRGLAYDNGKLYIADSGNQRIRVYENSTITTIGGGGDLIYPDTPYYTGDWADGSGENARFNNPQGLSIGKDGALYIADTDNAMIRKYKDGKVTTIASSSILCQPCGIFAAENELIVTDSFTGNILSIPL